MIPDMTGKTIEMIRFNYSLAIWTGDNWQLDLAGVTHITLEGGSRVEIDTTLCQDELTDAGALHLVGLGDHRDSRVSNARRPDHHLEPRRWRYRQVMAHEAWQIYGPSGEIIVCMPGGELAIWGPRAT